MENFLAGVFGSSSTEKSNFEESIGKKNESTAGITIYHRNDGGKRLSFLADDQFPDKIQGYSRIASLVDYAFFLYPTERVLTSADGELAVLIDSFRLRGAVVVSGTADSTTIRSKFKGLGLSNFPILERQPKSSLLDMSDLKSSLSAPATGTLVYIDRSFNVKGVGLVVLGFVISGKVSVHDKLRLVGFDPPKFAEVKGIQINDVDEQMAARGVRVGLSLKGADLKDLERVTWLDDSSFTISQKLRFVFEPCSFYKQPIADRDLHIQCSGDLKVCKISRINDGEHEYEATMQTPVPSWNGMRAGIIDLNGRPLRIAGGGSVKME